MINLTVFTSDLTIIGFDEIEDLMKVRIANIATTFDKAYSFFNTDSYIWGEWGENKCKDIVLPLKEGKEELLPYLEQYFEKVNGPDLTCMLKGLFILYLFQADGMGEKISEIPESFMINFGGDILCRGIWNIRVEDSFTMIRTKPDDCYAIFTSGNTSKRGTHITPVIHESQPLNSQLTSVYREPFSEDLLFKLPLFDAYTTIRYAEGQKQSHYLGSPTPLYDIWTKGGVSVII